MNRAVVGIVAFLAAAMGPGRAGAATTYEWRGTVSGVWTTPGNWIGSSVAPSGGNHDVRLNVYNNALNPLYYTAAQGTTVYAATNARPLAVGNNSGNAGQLVLEGGSLELAGVGTDVDSFVGNIVGTGMVVIAGGTLVATNGQYLYLGLGSAAGLNRGHLVISNGTAVLRALRTGWNNPSTGAVRIVNGTLELGAASKRGDSLLTFDFDGGLLKAWMDSATWIASGITGNVNAAEMPMDTDGHAVTVAGILMGAGRLTKRGAGTLSLSGANAYAGGTSVSGGVLSVNSDGALGAVPAGVTPGHLLLDNGTLRASAGFNLNVNRGVVLGAAGGTLIANSGNLYTDGVIADQSAPGALTIAAGGGTWIPQALNTHSGGTTLETGSLTVPTIGSTGPAGSPTAGPFGTALLTLAGGNLRATGSADITLANAVAVTADTTVPSSGGTDRNLILTGPVTLSGGTRTLTVNSASPAALVLSGAVGDGGLGLGLTKRGSGLMTLQGANSYGGATAVEQGRLFVRNNSALAGTSAISVSDGAQLGVGNGISAGAGKTATIYGRGGGDNGGALRAADGSATWAGNVLIGQSDTRIGANAGATLTVSGVIDDGANTFPLSIRTVDSAGEVILTAANTYGGTTAIVVGRLKIGGADDRLPVGSLLEIGNGSDIDSARFDLNGFNQRVAGLSGLGNSMPLLVTNSSAAVSTLTLDFTASRTYRGRIGGLLSLIKNGTGTQNLSGANTYAGTTTVNGGALLVNNASGSGTGSGPVTINGGTLGGTGSIAGAVVVAAGAKFAAGNSVGTNTVGSLALSAGSTFEVEADGAAADQTVSLGPVDLGGATLSTIALGAPTFTSALILSNATGEITGRFAGLYEADQVLIGGVPYFIHYRPTYVELNLTPTKVVLHRFGVLADGANVSVRWQTASEIGTAGFDLYRKVGDEWVKINGAMIAATGAPQGGVGASYAVTDAGAAAGGTYEYKLVEIEQDGTRREYGPYERTATAFEMTSPLRATPEGMEIRWLSRAGERYRVLRASELRKPAFEVVAGALEATPPENVFVDTNAAPLRVYRIELDE